MNTRRRVSGSPASVSSISDKTPRLEHGNSANEGYEEKTLPLKNENEGYPVAASELNPELSGDYDVYGNEETAQSNYTPPKKTIY